MFLTDAKGCLMSFKIFPYTIIDGERKPIDKGWRELASADPAVHQQWREFYRDRIKGWILPTGKLNGLFALDIDVKANGKNGFESLRAMGINELPNTAWQQSPSGGMHLFFKADNPEFHYPTSVNKELGLDLRGDGGFVWLYEPNFSIPIINAPAWVYSVTKRVEKERPVSELPQTVIPMNPMEALNKFNACIEAVKHAAQGERNHNLNIQSYLVGQIVASGAVSKDFAYESLMSAAAFSGLPNKESYATIMSGLGGGEANPITHPFGNSPPTPAFTIPALPLQPEQRARWTPTFGTLAMLQDWSKLKKPQLFEDWSTEDIHYTSAIGGVGKTTIKLFEATCLAQGESFLGFKCLQPGRTLFIVGEDSEAKLYAMLGRMCTQLGLMEPGQEHRLQAVLNNVVIKRAKDICLVESDPKTKGFRVSSDALEKLKEAIDDLKPKHIVFDPLGMFQGPESGGNDMATAMMRTIQEVQEYSEACVDIINHIGKDSHTKKDISQFSGRGATAVPNHSRVVRTLLKLNENEYKELTGEDLGESTAIYVHVSKFSDGSPILDKPFIILRNGYVFERKEIPKLKPESQTTSTTDMKQKVYQFIKLQNKPVAEKLITSNFHVAEDSISKVVCKSIINILHLEGLIEEVTGDLSVDKIWWQIKGD